MEFLIGQFIGLRYRDNPVHVFKANQVFRREFGLVANDSDNGDLFPLGKVGIEPAVFYERDNGFNAFR